MHKKHLLIMLACCLIPLAGVAAIWLFKLPVNNAVYFGLMLLCPMLHFVMMRDMLKPGSQDHAGHSRTPIASPAKPVARAKGQPSLLPPADKS